jgi:hypothetical protein
MTFLPRRRSLQTERPQPSALRDRLAGGAIKVIALSNFLALGPRSEFPAPYRAKTWPFSAPLRPPTPRLRSAPKVEDFALQYQHPPRRLDRSAGSDDPTFPKATVSCHPQKAPCFARHIFCSPPQTGFEFGCSSASEVMERQPRSLRVVRREARRSSESRVLEGKDETDWPQASPNGAESGSFRHQMWESADIHRLSSSSTRIRPIGAKPIATLQHSHGARLERRNCLSRRLSNSPSFVLFRSPTL